MNYPTGTGQLQNKTAVVTGGSRGIGRAIVDKLSPKRTGGDQQPTRSR